MTLFSRAKRGLKRAGVAGRNEVVTKLLIASDQGKVEDRFIDLMFINSK